ncbi:hypothetical protein PM082_013285 [Marasmius tenuissimus]|nr:hypothetical protein PM082_013285 [Marasmius tenuissimus]
MPHSHPWLAISRSPPEPKDSRSAPAPTEPPERVIKFLEDIWKDPANKKETDAFMDNFMCQYWARAPQPEGAKFDKEGLEALGLKGHTDFVLAIKTFQAFAVQDYFYLVDSIKFYALRLTKVGTDLDDIKAQELKIRRCVEYAEEWKKICIDREQLGIEESRLAKTKAKTPNNTDSRAEQQGADESPAPTERSIAELAYSNYLQNHTSSESFFNLHVVTAACIYGWHKLAERLIKDSRTKDNFFCKYWIKEALRSKSYEKLDKFLTDQKSAYEAQEEGISTKRWNELFRTALRLEVALFESSMDFFPPDDVESLRKRTFPTSWR